jgi:hypothetical protein
MRAELRVSILAAKSDQADEVSAADHLRATLAGFVWQSAINRAVGLEPEIDPAEPSKTESDASIDNGALAAVQLPAGIALRSQTGTTVIDFEGNRVAVTRLTRELDLGSRHFDPRRPSLRWLLPVLMVGSRRRGASCFENSTCSVVGSHSNRTPRDPTSNPKVEEAEWRGLVKFAL